jgi:hypothetical protein
MQIDASKIIIVSPDTGFQTAGTLFRKKLNEL